MPKFKTFEIYVRKLLANLSREKKEVAELARRHFSAIS